MQQTQFGPHELQELHEILASEATAACKLQASLEMVQNPQLKTLMQASLGAKQFNITQIENMLQGCSPNMQ